MSEINKMMLEDSKDMLDNVEITDIATQCKLLKDKEDEIAAIEEKLKAKKLEAEKKKQKPEYANNPAFGDPSHHSNAKNK